jgi:thiosulfate dehydrogenase [quinone] large subunit
MLIVMNEINPSVEIPEPKLSRFVFSDTRFAWVWLLLRLYVGYEWITAGWGKVTSTAWVGPQAGSAVQGFLKGALAQTGGSHPAVSSWYAYFINNVALIHPTFFSYLVAYGELAVGLGLILGAFTGIAAFFGVLMNFSYLFAGTVSINPLLLLIQLFLILAWRNAGWLGLDRWFLPWLGAPWQGGKLFGNKKELSPIEMLVLIMGVGLILLVLATLLFR